MPSLECKSLLDSFKTKSPRPVNFFTFFQFTWGDSLVSVNLMCPFLGCLSLQFTAIWSIWSNTKGLVFYLVWLSCSSITKDSHFLDFLPISITMGFPLGFLLWAIFSLVVAVLFSSFKKWLSLLPSFGFGKLFDFFLSNFDWVISGFWKWKGNRIGGDFLPKLESTNILAKEGDFIPKAALFSFHEGKKIRKMATDL